MGQRLRALDRAVYRIEKTVVVLSLLAMVAAVFLDVVHRTFADPDSELAGWIIKAINFSGGSLGPLGPDSPWARSIHAAAPAGLVVTSLWLTYFGFRSAKRQAELTRVRALVYALGTVFGVGAAIKMIVVVFPNGFVWSQPFALILLLWVGFLGASMCTYEGKHLQVEAVQRYLPSRFKPHLALASGLATAAFLLFLTYASLDYVHFHYSEWVDTEYRGGMFKGVDIPQWVGFLALPVSFLVMAVRFLGGGVAAYRAGDSGGREPS